MVGLYGGLRGWVWGVWWVRWGDEGDVGAGVHVGQVQYLVWGKKQVDCGCRRKHRYEDEDDNEDKMKMIVDVQIVR